MLGMAGFGFGFCRDGFAVGWVWVMCEMFGISRGMGWVRGVGGYWHYIPITKLMHEDRGIHGIRKEWVSNAITHPISISNP